MEEAQPLAQVVDGSMLDAPLLVFIEEAQPLLQVVIDGIHKVDSEYCETRLHLDCVFQGEPKTTSNYRTGNHRLSLKKLSLSCPHGCALPHLDLRLPTRILAPSLRRHLHCLHLPPCRNRTSPPILAEFLSWIKQDLGPWGPLVLAFAYIPLTVLAVPASILTLGGGYLFGLPVGFIADSIGATLGATAAFLIGRTIGRSYVLSKLSNYPKFQAVSVAIQRSGFKARDLPKLFSLLFSSIFYIQDKIVFLLRLVPLLPFSMLNYLLSVTPIGIGHYMLASWLGMMPSTFALVYVGTTVKDLSDVTHGWDEISTTHWVMMALGFVTSGESPLILDFETVHVVLIVCVTKIAKASLDKELVANTDKGILASTPTMLPIVAESPLNLHNPLMINIDKIREDHEKQLLV
ncbi:hypothetical protein JRO89_XS01G0260800 [Xanthoceras sorbifolium]|uniref:VTT domain-containing protein n=1 Tax=Xanthoceras sorbifolium TaxID=99658 RepID=A0ABQ8IN08_9ROSI|nr:hypothetical protein JRO89_XS01G0260800 [Xanthoceras sorbifolium]